MGNPEKLATQGTQHTEKAKQKHNTICVGHHYTQTSTNNVYKKWTLLYTTVVDITEEEKKLTRYFS